MSSVLVEDFYRPWCVHHHKQRAEKHFVFAGRVGMALMGLAMFVVAVLSFYWQRYANVPILELVLGVMAFAYAGLLGVYFTAVFTDRGSNRSVVLALAAGFLVVLGLQLWSRVAFPWQLCAGTLVAFLVCVVEKGPDVQH
ncbi:MAG TPA: sodium:solute symporter, partial [Myxococcota bacterium]|nr:sodium:solute symporter [Myxococcota bacterium]